MLYKVRVAEPRNEFSVIVNAQTEEEALELAEDSNTWEDTLDDDTFGDIEVIGPALIFDGEA